MKALSIKQPWASLIIYGGKDIENRTWGTSYRGRILILASKERDEWEFEAARHLIEEKGLAKEYDVLPWMNDGGVIGSVEVVDCVKQSDSPWFCGPVGWVLKHPKPLVFRPVKGRLGLWDMEYPESSVGYSLVLFLDVDGVLNDGVGRGLNDLMLARLGAIIRHADPAIVVSSSWRMEPRLMSRLTSVIQRMGGRVVGHTAIPGPDGDQEGGCRIIQAKPRWMEIHDWLEECPHRDEIRRFVILDDEADMGYLAGKHVRTRYENGLENEQVKQALRIFWGKV